MKVKIDYVCPVNIGYNEYEDKLLSSELRSDIRGLEFLTNHVAMVMSGINETPQTKRWGIAARIYLEGQNLGKFYSNGEFYPSEFYDNNPGILEA